MQYTITGMQAAQLLSDGVHGGLVVLLRKMQVPFLSSAYLSLCIHFLRWFGRDVQGQHHTGPLVSNSSSVPLTLLNILTHC